MIYNWGVGLEKHQEKRKVIVMSNKAFTATQFDILEKELEENFDLDEIELPDEYRYSSLPLCLIDAIFSIGVKYSSTKNTVMRYCDYYHIQKYRDSEDYLPVEQQHILSELIKNIKEAGTEYFAEKIVKNRQRTSSRNGILKSKAVLECAELLSSYGIETLNDFRDKMNIEIEKEFCKVKGQTSGISLAYLKMLCGDPNTIKPDRHILRFLNSYFDEEIRIEDAQHIFNELINRLRIKYNKINARQLDYLIWSFMALKDSFIKTGDFSQKKNMDIEMIKKEYEAKQQKLYDELNRFIEYAINYDDLLDRYESKENIDTYELEWNDAKDQRYYNILERKIWIVDNIISLIDEINDAQEDKKKQHRAKKSIETLVTEFCRFKKESTEIMEREQKMINDINSALDTLDEIRDK